MPTLKQSVSAWHVARRAQHVPATARLRVRLLHECLCLTLPHTHARTPTFMILHVYPPPSAIPPVIYAPRVAPAFPQSLSFRRRETRTLFFFTPGIRSLQPRCQRLVTKLILDATCGQKLTPLSVSVSVSGAGATSLTSAHAQFQLQALL